jgi:peptidoglycan hydrolase CwlO-like protein
MVSVFLSLLCQLVFLSSFTALEFKLSNKDWEKKKKIYAKKLTAELKDFNKQMDDLKKKAKKLVGKGKDDMLEEIRRLEREMAAIREKIRKLAATSEDAWHIARKGVDEAWHDLSKAFKIAANKLKKG